MNHFNIISQHLAIFKFLLYSLSPVIVLIMQKSQHSVLISTLKAQCTKICAQGVEGGRGWVLQPSLCLLTVQDPLGDVHVTA